MKWFCCLLTGLALIMGSGEVRAASAANVALKDVVGALEKGYATLQDVQADFSQRTTVSAIKKVQLGSGEVLLKRPGSATAMFRFNYTKPKQQIVSNGKQVWFYIPENKHTIYLRVPLSEGDIDYRFAISAMAAAGYQGYAEIEIFSQQVWDAPPDLTADTIRRRFSAQLG